MMVSMRIQFSAQDIWNTSPFVTTLEGFTGIQLSLYSDLGDGSYTL